MVSTSVLVPCLWLRQDAAEPNPDRPFSPAPSESGWVFSMCISLGRLVFGGVPYVCMSAIAPVFACSFMVQLGVIDSV